MALAFAFGGAFLPGGVQNALPPPDSATCLALKEQVDSNLRNEVLAKWYPRAVDERQGGFIQDFREDWTAAPGDGRSIVYQSRLTWTAARAAEIDPPQKAAYLRYVRHGLDALETRMWDGKDGGFYWSVDASGAPDTKYGYGKHAYGVSFGIYACAEAYRATRDPRALDLAKRAFLWLDSRAHDEDHGGYFEALTRDGSPIMTPPAGEQRSDQPGTTYGEQSDQLGTSYGGKSMNAHIHLLEAFAELYGVWPDPHLRSRLLEVFLVVRDRIAAPDGYLNLTFAPDWTPASHGDSYGHDVETAYLLVEAAEALGIRKEDAQTWTVARRLVDHALTYGWDAKHGGFFDEGPANGEAARRDKIWWTQAEGLNALLLMHERYGKSTAKYWEAFLREWEFIRDHQVDGHNGGWYPAVAEDGAPKPGRNKSDSWTDPYHQGRALMNVSARLRDLEKAHAKTSPPQR
jgi:mannobiose 2-epimerase